LNCQDAKTPSYENKLKNSHALISAEDASLVNHWLVMPPVGVCSVLWDWVAGLSLQFLTASRVG